MGIMSFDCSMQNKHSGWNMLVVSYQLLQLFDFEVVYVISFKFLLKKKHVKKQDCKGHL